MKTGEIDTETFFDPITEIEMTPQEIERCRIEENIARAATSWTAAFPGQKEVPRTIAKQARAMMNVARRENIRPSEVQFSDAGIEDEEEFMAHIMEIGGGH